MHTDLHQHITPTFLLGDGVHQGLLHGVIFAAVKSDFHGIHPFYVSRETLSLSDIEEVNQGGNFRLLGSQSPNLLQHRTVIVIKICFAFHVQQLKRHTIVQAQKGLPAQVKLMPGKASVLTHG